MKKAESRNRFIYYLVAFAVIFIYHTMYDLSFGDCNHNAFYGSVLIEGGNYRPAGTGWITALWNLSVDHWNCWSGRQVMEVFESIFAYIPYGFFMVVDVLFDLLIVYCMDCISTVKNASVKYWSLGLMLITFYIAKLGSAGYVSTSVVYSWTLACDFYILLCIKRLFDGEKLKKWQTLLSILAMILGFNQEQSCGMMFIILATFIGLYIIQKKHIPYQYLIYIAYAVFQLLIIVFCPGNTSRSLMEDGESGDFSSYSFVYKIYLGIWNTYRGWIKSPFTVIAVCSLLLFLVIMNLKKWNRTVGILNLLIAVFIFIFDVCIWVPDFYTENNGTFGHPESMKIFLFETLTFVLILWLIYWLIKDTSIYTKLLYLGCMIAIAASKVAIGFTPTFVNSGERTTIFFLFGIYMMMQFVVAENEKAFEGKHHIFVKLAGFGFMIVAFAVHTVMLSQGILY